MEENMYMSFFFYTNRKILIQIDRVYQNRHTFNIVKYINDEYVKIFKIEVDNIHRQNLIL